jgi:hypothetical protein
LNEGLFAAPGRSIKNYSPGDWAKILGAIMMRPGCRRAGVEDMEHAFNGN